MIREVREETGIDVQIITGLVPVYDPVVTHPVPFTIIGATAADPVKGPHLHVDALYVCCAATEPTGKLDHREVAGARWGCAGDMRGLGVPPELPAITEAALAWAARHRGRAAASHKTVDWIVVLPEVVLLVEVKSAIPTEPVRLGTPDAADAMLSKIGKAFTQIDVTAQLIADRDPALAAVPADRPVLGLAVTLEPFHVANAPFNLLPSARTPVTVADAAEIEVMVTAGHATGSLCVGLQEDGPCQQSVSA